MARNSELLIVQNISREGPGLIESVLRERRLPFRVADLAKGESFPDPGGFAAVVVLGGPDSANDSTPKMREELRRAEEILSEGIPYLGICLGMQILVKAAGGKVLKHTMKEIGWRDPDGNPYSVDLTPAGGSDPFFSGLASPLRVFQLHGETVELASGMALLAEGKFCRNQIVRAARNAYGIQSHFELTEAMLRTWAAEDDDLRSLEAGRIRADYLSVKEEYESNGKKIFGNFLRIALGLQK